MLAYLGRYTHRVAIANSRLVRMSDDAVTFRWKDYRHHDKPKPMTLGAHEFIRRFLLHTLPDGFHRIRHYGFLANGRRTAKLALCRTLLQAQPTIVITAEPAKPGPDRCPGCGGAMTVISVLFSPPPQVRPSAFRCDTS